MQLKIIIIIQSVLIAIDIVIVWMLIKNIKKVNNYKNKYEKALSRFNSEKGVKNEFINLYDRLKAMEEGIKNTNNEITEIKKKNKKSLNNVKLKKYNAYDESGNNLSFALALINEENNGVLLNEIYSKHGSNMYAKEIKKGNVKERISKEEQQVIKEACENKNE